VSRWNFQRAARKARLARSRSTAIAVSLDAYVRLCEYADQHGLTLKAALERCVADVGVM
jgi:hypothetical protein